MEISFNTKEESNKRQLERFQKLTKIERLYTFIRLSERISMFPTKSTKKSKNFLIVITN